MVRKPISLLAIALLSLSTYVCRGAPDLDLGDSPDPDLALLERTLAGTPGFPETAGPSFGDSVAAVRARLPDLEPHRAVAEMARLVALGRDGHTEISLLQSATGFRRLPVYVRWFDDGPRITYSGRGWRRRWGRRWPGSAG